MDTSKESIQEEQLSEINIDLTTARNGELNESFLTMFGGAIKMILKSLFGGTSIPVNITGTKSDISSFTKTIGREKNYLQTWSKYGLDNPRTYKSKAKLSSAVSQFERKTGLKWPFK